MGGFLIMNEIAKSLLTSAMEPSALDALASSVLGTVLQLPDGPELEQVAACCREDQICPWTEVAERHNLFSLMGQEVLPTSEMSVVCGKAKSGKTFFSSILLAAGLTPSRCRLVEVERLDPEPLRMLWFDTEQSRQSSKEILCQRILPLAQVPAEGFDPARLAVMNTTARDQQMRLYELIVQALTLRPQLIVVDGIVDLISSINDEAQAHQIVQQLRTLARHLDCAMLCVIHQNKGAEDNTLRGWVGTEAINKCFEMWELRKDKDTREFSVQLSHSRGGADPEAMKFRVRDNLPESQCLPQPSQPCKGDLRDAWRLPDSSYDLKKIFGILLPQGERVRSNLLHKQLCSLLDVGINKAGKIVEEAILSHQITKFYVSAREVYYCQYIPDDQLPDRPLI